MLGVVLRARVIVNRRVSWCYRNSHMTSTRYLLDQVEVESSDYDAVLRMSRTTLRASRRF
jgi:hypothetical protein